MPGTPPRWKYSLDQLPMVNARQREILDLIERGRTNQDIANHCQVTLVEAKSQVGDILATLGLSSREELADFWAWQRTRKTFRPLQRLESLPPRVVGAIAFLGLVAMVAIPWLLLRGDAPEELPVSPIATATSQPASTAAALAPSLSIGNYAIPLPAKGPEGRLAYIAPNGDLMVKPMPSGAPVVVRTAANQRTPKWAPSGRYLAFIEDGYLAVVDEQGRITQLTQPGVDATWAWSPSNDVLAFFSEDGMALYNAPSALRTVIRGQGAPYPERPGGLIWSPTGTRILYGVFAGYTSPGRLEITELRIFDLRTSTHTLLIEESIPAKAGTVPLGWSGDGRWIFYREPPAFGNSAWVGSVDVHTVPATGGASTSTRLGSTDGSPERFSAPAGPDLFAYVSGGFRFATDGGRRIELVSGGVRSELQGVPPGSVAAVTFSPEGLRLAYTIIPEPPPLPASVSTGQAALDWLIQQRLWVQTPGGPALQLTSDPSYRDEHPVWSADGKSILFTRINQAGAASIWRVSASGGQPELVQDGLGLGLRGVAGTYGWIEWTDLLDWSQTP